MKEQNIMLESALNYRQWGFSIIPVRVDKRPYISWKPFQQRQATEEEIRNWWQKWPEANIGIVTGTISGIVVVDVDNKHGGLETIKRLNIPSTPTVKTGGGGLHYFFSHPGRPVSNNVSPNTLPGVDLRGDGGYVVAAPSLHASGSRYAWVGGHGLADLSLAEFPDIVLARTPVNGILPMTANDKSPIKELLCIGVPEGERNDSLARVAGALFEKRLDYAEVLSLCLASNERCSPPLPEKEVKRTVESILKIHQRNAPDSPNKQVRVVGIDEFLKVQFPPRENVLEPWLPTQGLAMVHACRGVGKTHVGIGIAVAIASGGAFLRWKALKPRGVLYLDGEMPAVAMQERLSKAILSSDIQQPIAALNIITPDMQDFGMPDLATIEGQKALEPHLEGIECVIVDNISTLCRSGGESNADDWTPVQEWALRLRARGISVLFIHHSGKGGLQRGTSRREDTLDTVINLKHAGDYNPDQGAFFEIHFEKSRGIYGNDVKAFEAKLITNEKGAQEWVMKDLEESLTKKVADLISEGLKQNDIAEILGVSKGTVSKHKKKAQRCSGTTKVSSFLNQDRKPETF